MLKILYHADFDGMASAAILAGTAKTLTAETEFRFIPVDHHMTREWTQARPPAAGADGVFAVVDFLYHPEALVWADHHPTTFLTPEYEADFRRRQPTGDVVLDSQARSCASLLCDTFASAWSAVEVYRPLANLADQIDQAEFESPDAVYARPELHVRIDQARRFLTSGQMEEVVRKLMLPDVVGAEALVRVEADRALQVNQQTLQQYTGHQVKMQQVVVTDVVRPELPFLRFAAYYAFPTATYSITLYRGPAGAVRVGLNKNPWLDFHHWHLGHLARSVGGGGHSYAAGADFTPDRFADPYVAAVQWVQQQVLPTLHRPAAR